MALGFSFGKKKSSSTTNSTINKNEETNQTTQAAQNQTTTSNTSQTQTGQTNTTSQNLSNTNQTTAGTQATTGQESSTTQNYSGATLGGLENAVANLLSSSTLGTTQSISDFDADSFVSGGMQAAEARTRTALDESINGVIDAVGGKNNSAAALLSQRVNNDAIANLAGTRADLTARAEEIRRNNILAGSEVTNTGNQLLVGLLNALKGGTQTTTGQTAQTTTGTQTTTGSTSESGSQQQNNQQQVNTAATEQVASIMAQIIAGLTNTTATENSKTKGKSSGGGLSLSI